MGMPLEVERTAVGEGWQSLIDEADQVLRDIIGGDYELLQIKEKFGGLRFYWMAPKGTSQDKFRRAAEKVHEIEDRSTSICEACGAPGEQFTVGSWVKTECPSCYQRRLDSYTSRKGA